MRRIEKDIRSSISIPQYYSKYIDNKVDLEKQNKQCCPFHEEKTPSFSFSKEKGKWMCFGKCKTGGDVISLHQKNYNLASRDEAIESLARIQHIVDYQLDLSKRIGIPDMTEVDYIKSLNYANSLAKAVEDFLELDYIMSKYQAQEEVIKDLKQFVEKRRNYGRVV